MVLAASTVMLAMGSQSFLRYLAPCLAVVVKVTESRCLRIMSCLHRIHSLSAPTGDSFTQYLFFSKMICCISFDKVSCNTLYCDSFYSFKVIMTCNGSLESYCRELQFYGESLFNSSIESQKMRFMRNFTKSDSFYS